MAEAQARQGLAWAGVFALWLAACAPPPFNGTVLAGAEARPQFALTAHTGAPLASADLHGKVVLVFFGFTHCPDICSPTLSRLAAAMRELGARRAQVQVVFVTVDPERDTPAQLAAFLPRFDPAFIGLTGSADAVQAAARQFHVGVVSGEGGAIAHSGAVFALDRSGAMRLILGESLTAAQIAADVRRLLDAN